MSKRLRIMPSRRRRSAARVGKRGKLPRRDAITAEQFRDARVFAGLTREVAADLLGVSLRTVGHWETGKARPAYAAFKLLRVLRHGEMVDPRWAAYRIVRGRLVTPEGHEIGPADMAWLSLTVRRAQAFSELLAQRDALARGGSRVQGGTVPGPSQTAPAVAPAAGIGQDGEASPGAFAIVPMHGTIAEYAPTMRGVNYEIVPPVTLVGPCSNTGQNPDFLAVAAQPERSAHIAGGAA